MLNIREATLEDIDILTKLYGETLDYHNKLDSEYYKEVSEKTKGEFRKEVEESMQKDEIEVCIVEFEGKHIAFITFSLQKEDYFDTKVTEFVDVDEVYVQKEFRGKGIGKKLLQKVEDFAKEKGIKYISLHCSTSNSNALGFYNHLGFKDKQRILIREV